MSIRRKALLLVAIPLLFELSFVGLLVLMLSNLNTAAHEESVSKEIIAEASALTREYQQAVSFLVAGKVLKRPYFENQYDLTEQSIKSHIEKLQTDSRTHPDCKTDMTTVDKESEVVLRELRDIAGAYHDEMGVPIVSRYVNPSDFWDETSGHVQNLTNALGAIIAKEKVRNAKQLETQLKSNEALTTWICIGVVFSFVQAVLFSLIFERGISSRIQVLRRNTKLLQEKKTLMPPVGGHDEVSDLDRIFHEMASELTAAQKLRDALVSMASHDLKAPLTSLNLNLANLDSAKPDSPRWREQVSIMQDDVQRLIRLVNDFLDLQRLESGVITLELRDVRPMDAIEAALSSVSGLIESKQIELEIDCKVSSVVADRDRLIQVLVNLLSNAVKVSPISGKIGVATLQVGERVEFSISDNGPGLSDEMEKNPFNGGMSGIVTAGATEKGTGLGLSICKAIIERHGGEIVYRRSDSGGARFSILLPVYSADAEE